MIISAGNQENFNFSTPIGVGLIESAMNLSRLCLFDKPDSLIFVGSAGSYGKLKEFDIFETQSSSNIENSFLMNKSYTPLDNFLTTSEDVSHETIVNSSNYITKDKLLSRAYQKLKIDAENMEFFSVMKIAKEFNIPVKGIFIITNHCNENAHEDYMKNIKEAKLKLIEYLKEKGYIIEDR
jgi:nucleoside phosphorylase